MTDKIILNTRDLAVGYDGITLIPNIEFEVKRGEILVLIGPNGSGKSTILKTISGQIKSISGQVLLDGNNLKKLKEPDVAKIISLLLSKQPKMEYMTVEEVVGTGRYPYTGRLGILGEEDKKTVDYYIAECGLESIRNCDFDKLSDGQKQRVMLARAYCQEPDILIMDEPTSYLDIHHKAEMMAVIKRLTAEKNIAVVMSLHELDLAQKCADKILCIANGCVEKYGTTEDIFGSRYIESLYNITDGSFVAEYGCIELKKNEGQPKLFVIGTGNEGILMYRKLQRKGVPFATGVLHENDICYPVAKALAAEVISQEEFEPVSEENYKAARRIIDSCEKVICCTKRFGTMNENNRKLLEYSKENKKLIGSTEEI